MMKTTSALRGSWYALLVAALLAGCSTEVLAVDDVQKQVTDAQPIPPDRGAAGTWQLLKKLHTRASLLMIVAHPDDEDGATLAYEGRGLGVRTNLMQLNRGEGGANVMSGDYWDALGLVRTEELLQAGRYYGVDRQYFSTAADYGFSKSLKEAVDQWGHDRELGEAVRVVRISRPLVVCSVFVGGPTDGHGHHATAGLLAQEVFKAAGDPKMFPEQIKEGLLPWEPVKVYARVPFLRTSEKGSYDYENHTWGPLGVTNHVTEKWEPGKVATTLSIPVGTFDELIGQTYVQVAREGLGLQKSQNGGGEVPLSAPQGAMYHRFGSHIKAKDSEETMFDGIDTSLESIAALAGGRPPKYLSDGLRRANDQVERAMKAFTAQDTAAAAPGLVDGMKEVIALIAQVEKGALTEPAKYNILFELHTKQRQFNDALLSSLGLTLDADVVPGDSQGAVPADFRRTQTTFQMGTPGRPVRVNVHLFDGGRQPVTVKDIALVASSNQDWKMSKPTNLSASLESGRALDTGFDALIPADEPYSKPYFTRANLGESRYTISNKDDFGMPLTRYPLEAKARFEYQGIQLSVSKVVQVISRVEGPGVVRHPMPVGPPVSIALSPSAGVLPMGMKSFVVSVRLLNNVEGKATTKVRLKLPEGWRAEPEMVPFVPTQTGEERSVSFTVFPKAALGMSYDITAVADLNGKSYTEGYTKVGYAGLRPYFLYSSATYRTVGSDVKVAPDQKIGYVEGSGDDVPASLSSLGVHVSFLSSQDLSGGDLSKFDTILVGVRAYAVRPDLVANNARLLDYVKNGGVLMVQYNTPEFDHNFGPYPYIMTNDPEEVTNEHSKVQILDPKNPLFSWPNKITTNDFDNWIEERGSKFLSTWDPKYSALLETHDEGQPEQRGGLVYARYGKGAYIYNAYAFYRELPLGVPGAYRLFANMISLPRNPDFQAGR
jgi:LmbE family N-acetylglucosaminyl deacetylase